MAAAVRIVLEVVAYRLRRLEMANLAAAAALALALRLPLGEVVLRVAFGAGLNALAYLTNDYCDIEADLATGRADAKTRFLAEHRRAALGAQLGLAGLLGLVAALLLPELLVALVAGAGLCWWYSARLKRVPVADVLAMAAWGAAMPLVGVPLDSVRGWQLLGQLAWFSTSFELIQVLRDRVPDAAAGVRTTAVWLGETGTRWAIRASLALGAGYAALVLDPWAGAWLALAALLPAAEPDVLWNRVRLLLGLGWLGLLGRVYLGGA